ncbi:cationic amino acid transporter 2-like [Cydia pomonella]|uniref:cationic amino acid transporter 2-like n=1 Tax=Cydia pomonella TaxID=82600 RepID=UPI002ADD3AB1|nr:cationic amino acid transporter 2-like [Cydia pomonella]XP_061715834.1 cationic amino acid transporter 2-like [Cydia pomonella]XP_061715835.1 cationic amino acid transporter 2-like [Cydia pomonella]XP_061715836.1 cationic amino acid transporter 2-like [Cydia pomonella]
MAGKVLRAITRRKVFQPEQLEAGNLRRCLSVWDLTSLGISATLGVGIYYLVGSVALDIAGPSVVLSFFIAAVASLFAGLCYSEFGARVPRAGSAYIYTYVTVGELIAFIIGWNMILEALFGAASVARGLSLYVDLMAGKAMSEWFMTVAPLHWDLLATYFDFFAFGIVIAFGVLLAFGVRESATVNNVFAILNMIVIVFIVIAGSFTADTNNWFIPESSVPPSFGKGGFFPYGVWGTLRGAAVCFYGFVGFDSINATSEEVENPRRSIPHAILLTLLVVFLCYAAVAIVVTMMVPYYLHDSLASVATAFTYVGWDWGRWVVLVGAIFGISASLYGSIFPLPRLLYAMASDGLFFHWFARISKNKKSPVIGTLVPSIVIALLAGLLGLHALVMMMCVGTLLSYTIVAACIIILRYRSEKITTGSKGIVKQIFYCGSREATESSSRLVNIVLSLYIFMTVIAVLVTVHIDTSVVWYILLHVVVLMLLIVMMMQPQAKEKVSFMTPLVPVIPCFSIYINICLMVLINVQTWIRVAVWVVLGIIIYFICVCCYKRHEFNDLHTHKNGKPPVQIIIESPTPPDTIAGSSVKRGEGHPSEQEMSEIRPASPIEMNEKVVRNIIQEEVIIQQAAIIENNDEKEANIIDLLDQVLQAEEDTYSVKGIDNYGENTEKEDDVIIVSTSPECIPHRKSLSELSDAGSDASLGNQVLSKYDVIAQVHREDLPKLNEEDDNHVEVLNEENEHEQVTAFNDSDTNSQTDESGYSDTIDRTALTESVEEIKEDIPIIPEPPPFDENFFMNPNFKKAYTISSRPNIPKLQVSDQQEEKHRESIKSNSSQDDTTITFGSDRQVNFMSKLSQIYQTKIADQEEEQTIKPGRRSHSSGNVIENTEYNMTNRERPQIFLDMKKELLARDALSLRPVNKEEQEAEEPESEEETSMSRADLKSKLENIFATGGPMLLKPRLMKSNPPTPEESYQTDASSTESIAKIPKMDKNDTIGRQRARFGEVLNSFRLSLNKEDDV